MKKQYGLTAHGEALPKFQEVGLFLNVQRGSIRPAAAKSAAGCRNPNTTIATPHALAWFFVGTQDLSLEAAIMATIPTLALSSRLRSLIAHPCHSAALWRLCTPPPCCLTTYRVTPPDGGLIV